MSNISNRAKYEHTCSLSHFYIPLGHIITYRVPTNTSKVISKRLRKNPGLGCRACQSRGKKRSDRVLLDREEEKGHEEEGGQRLEEGYSRQHQFSTVLLFVRCVSWIIIKTINHICWVKVRKSLQDRVYKWKNPLNWSRTNVITSWCFLSGM